MKMTESIKFIHNVMKNPVEHCNGQETMVEVTKIPWMKMFLSIPVWAILVAHFCYSWVFITLLVSPSSAFTSLFKRNFAYIHYMPYFILCLSIVSGGFITDWLYTRKNVSQKTGRKLATMIGLGGPALLLVGFAYSNESVLGYNILCLAIACSGFYISGAFVNCLDIAPRYASVLIGLMGTVGSIANMFCPIVINHLRNSMAM